jgi:hypothetical protein
MIWLLSKDFVSQFEGHSIITVFGHSGPIPMDNYFFDQFIHSTDKEHA